MIGRGHCRTSSDPVTPIRIVRMLALENVRHRSSHSRPHVCLGKYQPPLLSLSCLSTSAFSRSRVPPPLLLPSLSLSLRCRRRASVPAQRPRRGLSTSGPQRGSPSDPQSTRRRNRPMALLTSRPTWQPGTNGSLVDLAPSHNHASAASLLCHVAAIVSLYHTSAASELCTLTSLHSSKQHGDVALC